MILANVTTPLLGLVDTAVLGRMGDSHFLAGASIGALILTQLYWLCGFLRMATTGLSAQAKGQLGHNPDGPAKVFVQGVSAGLLLGLMIIALQVPLLKAGLALSDSQGLMAQSVTDYFQVRVWGAPAALINLALIGFLVGQQQTRQVMFIQIIMNLLNAALNLLFVYRFGWQVEGVAAASVIAEYTGLFLAMLVALPKLRQRLLLSGLWMWLSVSSLRDMLKINGNMLLRNMALQLCLAFMAFQGARIGEMTAATNAILMQFFVLISLGLDGVAYAVEALVGEAKGRQDRSQLQRATYLGLLWSGLFALSYSAVFFVFGDAIIVLLSDQPELQQHASQFLVIVWLLPVIAHWCFLYDGVFVGLTDAASMRNTMIISAIAVYFPVWWSAQHYGNWGLWTALLAFFAARGLSLGYLFHRRYG
ncbi:MATE family efflux transporter [Aestuariibacter salexigens]|uniref:MATE family efflux transporter n=1 Tax=Aestuariibacter salexigens TaxID=226010 RepID=UPI000420A057|nr:MATE family efflux transporter [Aestuariibacter salexigens]